VIEEERLAAIVERLPDGEAFTYLLTCLRRIRVDPLEERWRLGF
jgi:hypothetical protein